MEAELAYSRRLPEVRKLLGLQTGLMISRVGSKRCAAQRVWGLYECAGAGACVRQQGNVAINLRRESTGVCQGKNVQGHPASSAAAAVRSGLV
jgi:hypothetical protein